MPLFEKKQFAVDQCCYKNEIEDMLMAKEMQKMTNQMMKNMGGMPPKSMPPKKMK